MGTSRPSERRGWKGCELRDERGARSDEKRRMRVGVGVGVSMREKVREWIKKPEVVVVVFVVCSSRNKSSSASNIPHQQQ